MSAIPSTRIVRGAVEPVKAPLRRAQIRRAALTEPTAPQDQSTEKREWQNSVFTNFFQKKRGDISIEAQHFICLNIDL
jgi:hypothetical protein